MWLPKSKLLITCFFIGKVGQLLLYNIGLCALSQLLLNRKEACHLLQGFGVSSLSPLLFCRVKNKYPSEFPRTNFKDSGPPWPTFHCYSLSHYHAQNYPKISWQLYGYGKRKTPFSPFIWAVLLVTINVRWVPMWVIVRYRSHVYSLLSISPTEPTHLLITCSEIGGSGSCVLYILLAVI